MTKIFINDIAANCGRKRRDLKTFTGGLASLHHGLNTGDLVIPSGLRYLYQNPNLPNWIEGVIEIPTGVYNLHWYVDNWNKGKRTQSLESVRIALPHVIIPFGVMNKELHTALCYFSNEPLTSLDQKLYPATLPNVRIQEYLLSLLCVSYNIKVSNNPYRPVSEWASTIRNEFFSTIWNKNENVTSLYDMCKIDKIDKIYPIHNWISNTAKDPSFITKVDWPYVYAMPLRKIMRTHSEYIRYYPSTTRNVSESILSKPIFDYAK